MSLLTALKPISSFTSELPADRHWTRDEYYRLVELGVLGEDDHVELIGGRIVDMPPQMELHTTGIRLTDIQLHDVFGQGYDIRSQMPLDLGADSVPEPDIAVVKGSARDYMHNHPTSAVLIVEVTNTTLSFDRNQKAGLYASAGILDYWLLDVSRRVLEVRRNPLPDPDHPFGFRYGDLKTYLASDSVTPLAAPGKSINVADLLP